MSDPNVAAQEPTDPDGFFFRYGVHPEHLEAPRASMAVLELKEIIRTHVAGFDPAEGLLLEDVGDEPDRSLRNDELVEIVSIPHFYSATHPRDYTIFVNAEQKTVHKRELSFDEIVAIAYPNPKPGLEVRYTITYKRAVAPKPQGKLTQGHSVVIRKHGTIFDVVRTYKS
jgi:hypothetical protein